ncbi:MAG TPA: MarR family transcriptional regulator [Kribbellaceae bacterium]|nr:MarR family transcriptional regulator [Kribbellaceae bacterium]
MDKDSVDRMIEAWADADPTLDPRPLEVVGRLLLCAQHCQQQLVAALRPLDLSFGDFDVLNTLRRRADPHGTNPSQLAQSSLITTGAMTARLHRLERSGLITRVPDRGDGRAVRIRLTARGSRLARKALQAVLEADEAFLEPLQMQQRDTVASILKLLLLHNEAT